LGYAGFDAIWAEEPEGADGTGGRQKEEEAIKSLVDAGERIYARYYAHSIYLDRLYLNKDNFPAYRLPLSWAPAARGVPIYLTDRQVLTISIKAGMRGRIKAYASGYSYKQLHHTGYRTDDPVHSPPWIALFGGEISYTEYVFVVRFKTPKQRDKFSEHLHELHVVTIGPELGPGSR